MPRMTATPASTPWVGLDPTTGRIVRKGLKASGGAVLGSLSPMATKRSVGSGYGWHRPWSQTEPRPRLTAHSSELVQGSEPATPPSGSAVWARATERFPERRRRERVSARMGSTDRPVRHATRNPCARGADVGPKAYTSGGHGLPGGV